MGQTLIEKIAQRFAVGLGEGQTVHAGDFLSIRPAHVMTHDNTAAVIPKFQSMGTDRVRNPKQPVYGLDHDIQNITPENLGKYAKIEAFAKKQGVVFFPLNRRTVGLRQKLQRPKVIQISKIRRNLARVLPAHDADPRVATEQAVKNARRSRAGLNRYLGRLDQQQNSSWALFDLAVCDTGRNLDGLLPGNRVESETEDLAHIGIDENVPSDRSADLVHEVRQILLDRVDCDPLPRLLGLNLHLLTGSKCLGRNSHVVVVMF